MAPPDDDDGDLRAGDALGDVVPVPLAAPRLRAEPARLQAFSFQALMYRRVCLRVNGFDVVGEFRGADEDDVYLRGELRWFVYPLSSVTGVMLLDDDDEQEDDDDGADEPLT